MHAFSFQKPTALQEMSPFEDAFDDIFLKIQKKSLSLSIILERTKKEIRVFKNEKGEALILQGMALTRLTFMLRHILQSSIFNETQRRSPTKVMTSLASSLLFAIVLFAYATMSTGLLNSVTRPCTWQLEIVADRKF